MSLVEITDVAGTIVYGSVSNPSSDTFTIALTTNIVATTTSAQYRIRVTPKSHAAMPAPPGTSYALTAHITDWTGTNAHDGGDSGNTIITIDNLSPGNVTNATATAASTQVLLAWTNPADSDLGTIVVLRRAGAVVSDTPVGRRDLFGREHRRFVNGCLCHGGSARMCRRRVDQRHRLSLQDLREGR